MSNKITMPWEERPADCADVMWRYSQNPVIGRYHIPSSNSIFNSAVVPFKDGYAGVFRCDNRAVQMNIFAGFSKDGIHWEIEHEPIKFKAGNTDMIESEYKYDPRVYNPQIQFSTKSETKRPKIKLSYKTKRSENRKRTTPKMQPEKVAFLVSTNRLKTGIK